MKMITRIILLIMACGLGFWLWTVFFPSPREIALKKITSLAATATVNANDSNLTRAGKAVKLAGFFSTNVEIVVNIPDLAHRTVTGREQVKESAMAGFQQITSLQVQFFDVTATVAPDKQTVDVSCTLKVSANGRKDYGVQELHVRFKKLDGDWLITRVETVQTLTRRNSGTEKSGLSPVKRVSIITL